MTASQIVALAVALGLVGFFWGLVIGLSWKLKLKVVLVPEDLETVLTRSAGQCTACTSDEEKPSMLRKQNEIFEPRMAG